MIYKTIIQEYERIIDEINSIKLQLETFPEGHFLCTRNQNRYKWYHCINHHRTYIPKRDRAFAEQMATKQYLRLRLDYLQHEKEALTLYLQHHKETDPAEQLLTTHPEYQKLLSSHFCPLSKELNDWASAPYDCHQGHAEQLSICTCSGKLVRSKSEALIDMILSTHKLPFRYECALPLGNSICYPDFTIRHPHTGKTFYWEHFGLMDDPTYCKNAFAKLQLYAFHNILPTINLITTYETKEHPLSPATITKLVEEYFL